MTPKLSLHRFLIILIGRNYGEISARSIFWQAQGLGEVLTSLDDGTNSYITENFTKGENDVIGGKNYTVYSK